MNENERIMNRALLDGVLIVVVGTLVAASVGKIFKVDLPPACKDWNRNYTMEISLFVTGVMAHYLRGAVVERALL